MLMGALFMLLILVILVTTGAIETEKRYIVIKTKSKEAIYDGTTLKDTGWEITNGSLKKGHRVSLLYKGEQRNVGESENVIEVKIYDEAEADVTSDYNIRYEFGTLKVNPRALTISSTSANKLYDGFPLTSQYYDVKSSNGGVVEGQELRVVVTGSITEVGVAPNTVDTVMIYDRYGSDVTRNYQLTIREGILQVFSEDDEGGEDVDPIIPSTPVETEWNDPLFSGESNLLPSEGDKDRLLYSVFSEKDDTLYLKLISYGKYNGHGWEKAPKYSMLTEDGYSAMYLSSLALEQVGAKENRILLSSTEQPLAFPYYALNNGGWTNDATFDILMEYNCEISYLDFSGAVIGTRHPYSEYEAEYRKFVYSNYLEIDDETREYMDFIIKEQGFDKNDIEITDKVARYIMNAASYNSEYNKMLDYIVINDYGRPSASKSNVAVAFLSLHKEGVCKHYATAATLLFRALGIPARYTVGVMSEVSAGMWTDITAERAHAWVEVYLDGTGWIMVEVTGGENVSVEEEETDKMTVVLSPAPISKVYDGTELEVSNKLIGFEELEKLGYSYFAENEGSRIEPGISQSHINSVVIFDGYGNDITNKFDIKTVSGTVKVYVGALTFESESYVKEYDGRAEVREQLTDGALPEGYDYKIVPLFEADAGKQVCSFDVIITDSYGNDMTDYFHITKKYGIAEIIRLKLTVKAGDAEKQYDGTPLSFEEISIEFGELAAGHRIGRYSVEGSQTEPGRSENLITSIMILNEDGKDVTKNYIIELKVGKLTVSMKRPLAE